MWSLDGSTSIIGTEKVFRIFIIIFLLKSLIGFFLRWWRLDCHPFQTIMSIQHCEYQQNDTNCPIFLDIPFARGKKLKKQHVVQVYFGWLDALPKGELCRRLCRAASPLWARSCRALWGQPGSRSYKKVCLPCHLTTWNCTSTWNCTLLNFQRSRTDPQGGKTGIRGSSPSSPRRCIFFRNHCCWNRRRKITAINGQHLVFW